MKLNILARTWLRFEVDCEPTTEAISSELEKKFNVIPCLAGDQYVPYLDNEECITDSEGQPVEISGDDSIEFDIDTPPSEGPGEVESFYVLFGIDAVTVFENEGMKGLVKAIRKNDVCTYECREFSANASPKEILYATDGWNGYAFLTKKEFQKLQTI